MIGRRGLLSLLGFGGAGAVSAAAPTDARALPMWVEQEGDWFNVRVLRADGEVVTAWRWGTGPHPKETVPLSLRVDLVPDEISTKADNCK